MVAKKKVEAAAPEEKKPETKVKKQKKAPARKRASAEPVAVDPDADIPRDLRGSHRRGRVSNKERMSKAYIDEQKKLLAADLLQDLKNARKNMTVGQKTNLLSMLLRTIVFEDDTNDESSLTLELMGQRYLGLKIEMKNAEKASMEAFSAPKEDG